MRPSFVLSQRAGESPDLHHPLHLQTLRMSLCRWLEPGHRRLNWLAEPSQESLQAEVGVPFLRDAPKWWLSFWFPFQSTSSILEERQTLPRTNENHAHFSQPSKKDRPCQGKTNIPPSSFRSNGGVSTYSTSRRRPRGT